ncbi:MAG: putative zinc-binding protein [Promethearchaeota archaeon]
MSNSLVKKKVGIIACSGEELVGGAITRAAARAVVEFLRPEKTIILCQPLFMAGGLERHGGQQERNFAKEHPTITLEGCHEDCVFFAVDKYSGKPKATFRVEEYLKKYPDLHPEGREILNADALKIVEAMAADIAVKVDEHFQGSIKKGDLNSPAEPKIYGCNCGKD